MRKPHRTSHLSVEATAILNRAKQPMPKAAARYNLSPSTVVQLIATGKITREMSCDGKARFRTYEYAENEVRPALEVKYSKTFEVYACAFCDGFHLATAEEFAA